MAFNQKNRKYYDLLPEEEAFAYQNSIQALRTRRRAMDEDKRNPVADDILAKIRSRDRKENEKQTAMDVLAAMRQRERNAKPTELLFPVVDDGARMGELKIQDDLLEISNTLSMSGTISTVANPPYTFAVGTGSTDYIDLFSIIDNLKEDIESLKSQISESKNENPKSLKFEGKMLAQTTISSPDILNFSEDLIINKSDIQENSYLKVNDNGEVGYFYAPYIPKMIIKIDHNKMSDASLFDYAMEILK